MRILLLLLVVLPACIPYTVGTTAQPVAPGQSTASLMTYFAPHETGVLEGDSATQVRGAYMMSDMEARFGLDKRSDLGIRAPGMSGVVLSYKRLLTPVRDDGPAIAALVGGGLVHMGNHLYFEAALLASGRDAAIVVPYGGVRAMHVVPLTAVAPSDAPTLGGFLGARIGTLQFGVSPEVGIYHDPSATGIRSSSLLVIPSITVHGWELVRVLTAVF